MLYQSTEVRQLQDGDLFLSDELVQTETELTLRSVLRANFTLFPHERSYVRVIVELVEEKGN